MLNQLKTQYFSGEISIPDYDQRDARYERILNFLDSNAMVYQLETPGNDLFAYKFCFCEKWRTEVFLKFKENFFTLLNYEIVTGRSFSYMKNDQVADDLKQWVEFLKQLGFTFIACRDLMAVDLGQKPLDDGLTSNTLFSVYLES